MKDKSISHISKEPDSLISPFFDFLEKKIEKSRNFSKKILEKSKKGEIEESGPYLCTKSIYLSFASGSVKKYWELREEIDFP